MPKPHDAHSVFLLCLNCGRGEWRKVGPQSTVHGPQSPTADSGLRTQDYLPACLHCGGPTERRYPVTLHLREPDRGLLREISDWSRTKADDAGALALRREFRRLAAARLARGAKLAPWVIEWLQNNPDK